MPAPRKWNEWIEMVQHFENEFITGHIRFTICFLGCCCWVLLFHRIGRRSVVEVFVDVFVEEFKFSIWKVVSMVPYFIFIASVVVCTVFKRWAFEGMGLCWQLRIRTSALLGLGINGNASIHLTRSQMSLSLATVVQLFARTYSTWFDDCSGFAWIFHILHLHCGHPLGHPVWMNSDEESEYHAKYARRTVCLDYVFKRILINIKCVQICQWGSARVAFMPLNNTIRISCRLRALPPIGVLANRDGTTQRHCRRKCIYSVLCRCVVACGSWLRRQTVCISHGTRRENKNSGENDSNARHHTSDNNNELLWEYSTLLADCMCVCARYQRRKM